MGREAKSKHQESQKHTGKFCRGYHLTTFISFSLWCSNEIDFHSHLSICLRVHLTNLEVQSEEN